MAAQLTKEEKIEMIKLAELLLTQSKSVMDYAKTSNNKLICGIAYGVNMMMAGAAQKLVEIVEVKDE